MICLEHEAKKVTEDLNQATKNLKKEISKCVSGDQIVEAIQQSDQQVS